MPGYNGRYLYGPGKLWYVLFGVFFTERFVSFTEGYSQSIVCRVASLDSFLSLYELNHSRVPILSQHEMATRVV